MQLKAISPIRRSPVGIFLRSVLALVSSVQSSPSALSIKPRRPPPAFPLWRTLGEASLPPLAQASLHIMLNPITPQRVLGTLGVATGLVASVLAAEQTHGGTHWPCCTFFLAMNQKLTLFI